MSATCAALNAVTGLFDETTATTSSARAPLSTLTRRQRADNPMSTRSFMARSSEDEVRGDAEDIRAAAGLKTGLDVAEAAVGALLPAHVIVLRLERGIAPGIPAHARGPGALRGDELELRVEHRVERRRGRGDLRRQSRQRQS